MLDKYYYGIVTRISPEAPVPVNVVKRMKETLGGAANVAHNLARLGVSLSLLGYVGHDYHGKCLLHQMHAFGIATKNLVETDASTTTKLRVLGGHQQMMRIDFEDLHAYDAGAADMLLSRAENEIKTHAKNSAVILSDYGKGVCTSSVCQRAIKMAHAYGIPVIVDPKGADWKRYRLADFITPNVKELNEVQEEPVHNDDGEVERASRYAMAKFNIQGMLATRSEKGLSLIADQDALHIPTMAQDVYDVSGAGDTVIAVFAAAIASGMPPRDAAWLANLAAGIVVAHVGTYAVCREELLNAWKTIA